jgi:hypothetical protein
MQLSEVLHIINSTKLYYLNILGRPMLRPLLLAFGGESGFGSELIPTPLTPDARPPDCLTACFFRGLFDLDLNTCFLFFSGA